VKSKLLLVLSLFAYAVTTLGGAAQLDIQAVPGTPEVHTADTTITHSDGSRKTIKAPYLSVQFQIGNQNSDDDYTVGKLVFSTSAALDEEREMYPFTLEPPLKLSPGETKTTKAFYLEGLPPAGGSSLYFSVSVTGWKNIGSDPGDRFAVGAGFKAK